MPVSRRIPAASGPVGTVLAVTDEFEAYASLVEITEDKPPGRHTVSNQRRRTTLGPTQFDVRMYETYMTGRWGRLTIEVQDLQEIRLRLARSTRYLSDVHADKIEQVLDAPPFIFKTSLVVTTLGRVRLAEGPTRGNLWSAALDRLKPADKVYLWFQMHLPMDLGRRAAPESY